MRLNWTISSGILFLFLGGQAFAQNPAPATPDFVREAIALTFPQDDTVAVKFRGTHRLPSASGEAKVERKKGTTEIEMELDEMKPASLFGGDYNTYVLWVVSPEGQTDNVGEFILEGNRSKLNVSTNLGTFAMFVAAEPHYLVGSPSRFIVLENRGDIPGLKEAKVARIQYRGFEGVYNFERETLVDAKEAKGEVRNDVKQAYTAVRLAQRAGAEEFAPQEWTEAQKALEATVAIAQDLRKHRQIDAQARETVRLAVAAQKLAQDRAFQAALESERKARREEMARLESAIREATTEAERARLEAERRQLQLQLEMKARGETAARAEESARLAREAEARAHEEAAARTEAEVRAREATEAAEKARREREEALVKMKGALSQIAETRESARGLIVNIPDLLFDFNKATLRSEGRERLSKIAGIVLATPGAWNFSIEGHTDSVGSDEYNQNLSEKRAETVNNYMAAAGVPRNSITSKGFGESRPLASNDTPEGRQRNRRVEIVIEDRGKPISQR